MAATPAAAIARDDDPEADAARDAADMHAWVDGDAHAFDALYARHRDGLWRFVRRSVRDEALAHELYQDVWMRVVDARETWRPDGRFIGWLFAIARHRLVDHARSEARRPAGDDGHDVDALAAGESGTVATLQRPLSPEERTALAQDGARLDRELARLPAAQREAILMRHVAGLSLVEIADITTQQPEAVKSRLRHGINRLRERLRSPA